MPTTRWCCRPAASSRPARMPRCSTTTAGTRASGATSNCKRASMPAESLTTKAPDGRTGSRRDLLGESARLLVRAARPDARHFWLATLWLVAAAALEATGPLIGKYLIDHYLLPRNVALVQIGALLLGALVGGMLSSWLRYRQLWRLAGLAMRSVQRVREEVYGHVLRLPMAFFDRAITGQLVSRVTHDTEAVQSLYV